MVDHLQLKEIAVDVKTRTTTTLRQENYQVQLVKEVYYLSCINSLIIYIHYSERSIFKQGTPQKESLRGLNLRAPQRFLHKITFSPPSSHLTICPVGSGTTTFTTGTSAAHIHCIIG